MSKEIEYLGNYGFTDKERASLSWKRTPRESVFSKLLRGILSLPWLVIGKVLLQATMVLGFVIATIESAAILQSILGN